MSFHEFKNSLHFNCTVKRTDEKGKEQVCNGQIKEWLTAPPETMAQVGPGEALYRCRRCLAVYKGKVERHLKAGPGAQVVPPQFPVIK